MSRGISLHPEYGLNPAMDCCIICHKAKGLVLLGNKAKKLTGAEEAPREMITSLEPCEECREKYFKHGVMLVEATPDRKPTGHVMVINEEAYQHLFGADIAQRRISFVAPGILTQIEKMADENEKAKP